jgi:hypothetical protein
MQKKKLLRQTTALLTVHVTCVTNMLLYFRTAGGVQHSGLDQEPHAGEEAGATDDCLFQNTCEMCY